MRRAVALLAVAVLSVAPPSAGGVVTHEPCSLNAVVSVFKPAAFPAGHVLENLGFDPSGAMWVSNATTGRVHKLDAGGADLGSFALPSPGALTIGPDGLMYANYGNAFAGALLRTGQAGVVRFDWSLPPAAIVPQPFASGLDMANGGIFDAAGNYYVSNDAGDGPVKITPDGTVDRNWVRVWGTNGLVVRGDSLYAAITFDQRSPIERIPLADSGAHTTAVQTTAGVASLQPAVYTDPDSSRPLVGLKGLDDMTLGPDGMLWVVANGMGEVLRIDPDAGTVCLVAGGLQSPSSIRFSSQAGPFGGDAFVTEFSGVIRRIHIG